MPIRGQINQTKNVKTIISSMLADCRALSLGSCPWLSVHTFASCRRSAEPLNQNHAHLNGHIKGINRLATSHMSKFIGTPIFRKSLNRYPPGPYTIMLH